jgi:type IV pilus secretin PilQ/predicted competence protein
MKTRLTRIRTTTSSNAKGILLFLLAFAVPGFNSAQDKPAISRLERQSAPVSISKAANAGSVVTEVSGAAAAKTPPSGIIKDLKITPEDGRVTVTVATTCLLAPQEFMLENSRRLVLDFPNTENKIQSTRFPVNAAAVKQIRVSQFQDSPSPIARMVFELEENSGTHEMTIDKSSISLVFHQGQNKPNSFSAGSMAKSAARPSEIISNSKISEAKPNEAPSTKQIKIAAVDSKARPMEMIKSASPAASPAAAQPKREIKSIVPAGNPLPSSAENISNSKISEAKPNQAPSTKQTKITAVDSKTRPVETIKSASPAASPAAAQPKREIKSIVPAGNPLPSSAENISNSKISETKPNQAPHTKQAEATVVDSKTRPVETIKSTSPAASTAAAQPKREIKSIVPAITSFPIPTESSAKILSTPDSREPEVKAAANQAPLVARRAPEAAAAPKMMTSSGNSRFSGQPLTLDFVDTPLVDFFRLLAEEGGINIVLDPSVKGNISIKVVKLPWDQIFEAALVNNGLDKKVEGSLVRVARKATLQEEARQQKALNDAAVLAADLDTRIKRLNYAKAATLVAAISDQKTVRGTVVVDERTNSLILTDLPGSIDKQIKLIELLDMPQPQVEIEARIVSATTDFAREIGIQFGFIEGNSQHVTVRGPNTFGTIGSSGTTTGDGGNYNVNLPATKAFGGLGVSIGNILDTFLLDAAITAGESNGRAKLISNPRVTVQNNTTAEITQGLRFPVPVNANNTVTVQFFNAALKLTVTPQITYEGNIVLDLKVENNTPDFARKVQDVPSIRTSESTTRVQVSDGGTTVIGGIRVEDESTTEDKVPGLGSLPIVGKIFTHKSVARSMQEVMFYITPRIVKNKS